MLFRKVDYVDYGDEKLLHTQRKASDLQVAIFKVNSISSTLINAS